ncbi:recombinase family protein [Pontixanthobacter gangjinensis]|uniref:Recombinase family protein n=1 Tax=Pontixanthobacter gangjinensis TaxID=1028742 RepID=A0A6I4SJG6_9SPHN|nr:recombinase family protein [Pontixanthobacter gangjinensis]MXO55296.1 recombinase family protein [Pontixanthobacter gangjinensis]
MKVGYARTSTFDQIAGLEAQITLLSAVNCERLFTEQVSSVGEREQFQIALDFVRDGDALVVTRLDRLARSTSDLLGILDRLEAKGVALRILDFGGTEMDTKSPTGKLMLTMFGALAQFERELMLVRQREGIERAKREGKYKGRAPTARRRLPEMRLLSEEGLTPPEIANRLNCSRASVYRLLKEDAS